MKEILITGGSEGIGLAIAKEYARKNTKIHLVARNQEKLIKAKQEVECLGASVEIHICDLSDLKQVEQLKFQIPRVDVCILNAGIGYTGSVINSDEKHNMDMVHVNVTSTMMLADYYVKRMVEVHQGSLILLSSTGCFQPGPYIALYYATKAFVTSYGRALAQEVKDWNVHVCVVCPGPVHTDFYEKSGVKAPKYAVSAEYVAKQIHAKAEKKTLLVIGRMNQFLRIIPTGLKIKFIMRSKQKILEQISEEN